MATGGLLILMLAACSASNRSPSATSARTTSAHRTKVTSTLDGRRVLPRRIHWRATPRVRADQVSEVDFLIDGKVGWVEHKAPYYYGDDGNWLVTSFLKPEIHTFTVHMITIQGTTATDAVRASVSVAPPPPATIASTWTRRVSAADVKQATSGQPPPPGRWKLRIDRMGWHLRDPTPGATWGLFDVVYRSGHDVQLRPTIEHPPYPNSNNGGFCGDTDPIFTWTYLLTNGGTTLTLHPRGNDPCGDRLAVLDGSWTRIPT